MARSREMRRSIGDPYWVGMGVTVVGIAAMAWLLWSTHRDFTATMAFDVRLQRLHSELLYLDEVLAASTQMAAQSGEARWAERYHTHHPRFTAVLEQSFALAGETGTHSAGYRRVAAAAEQRTAMDIRVLELATGDTASATALLASPSYLALVRDTTGELLAIHNALDQRVDYRLGQVEGRLTRTVIVSLVILGLLLAAWGGVILRIQRRAIYRGLQDRFLEQVLAAQETERRRIAAELHDGIGQSLTSLLIGLKALDGLPCSDDARITNGQLRALASAALEDLGRMVRGLHPIIIEEVGFTPAVARLRDDVAEATGMTVELELLGFEPEPQFSAEVSANLYRMLQEALNNVARHSGANTVSVILERHGDRVRAIVEDDGRGFDANVKERGFGLQGLHERAQMIGGTVDVESRPGNGTTVYVDLPMQLEPGRGVELDSEL